jgi:hypothetical protein
MSVAPVTPSSPICRCCGGPRSVYSAKWCVSCYRLKTRPEHFGKTGYRLVLSGSFWMAVGPDELIDPNNAYRGVGRTPEEAVKILFSFGHNRLRAHWKRTEPGMPALDDFVRETVPRSP